MSAPHRPVDPQQSFPALEEAVLERWREQDVFPETVRRRKGAAPWIFYEGPPTANGRPGTHHVLARDLQGHLPALQDDAAASTSSARAAGTATACRSSSRSRSSSASARRTTSSATGSRSSTPSAASRSSRYVEEWKRLTERIGYWVDLDEAYRTLDDSYIESVWWALKTIWEKGLLYEGHKVVPYCPRCGTALSSHELGQPGAYKDVIDPSVYVRFPVTKPAGPLRDGDELLIWTTTPWTLVSNAAVAVDPELTYVRARAGDGRSSCSPRRWCERVLGEEAEIVERFAGARARSAPRTSRRSRSSPAPPTARRATPCCPATSSPPRTAPGSCTRRSRSARTTSASASSRASTVVNPVKPDGTYDERIGPYAGRAVREANADLVEDLRARGRLLRAEDYEHAYPHCWRCGTRAALLREAVLVHPHLGDPRPAARLQRDGQLAPAARQARALRQLAGGQRRLGALARALLGHAAAGVALRRTATSTASARSTSWRSCSGVRLEDAHRPYVDEVGFPCGECGQRMHARARGDRRVVRLRRDAVRAVARAARERGALRGALPGRLRLRGARPDARLVLLAARRLDAAVRPAPPTRTSSASG